MNLHSNTVLCVMILWLLHVPLVTAGMLYPQVNEVREVRSLNVR
jgi:hypothetical protein